MLVAGGPPGGDRTAAPVWLWIGLLRSDVGVSDSPVRRRRTLHRCRARTARDRGRSGPPAQWARLLATSRGPLIAAPGIWPTGCGRRQGVGESEGAADPAVITAEGQIACHKFWPLDSADRCGRLRGPAVGLRWPVRSWRGAALICGPQGVLFLSARRPFFYSLSVIGTPARLGGRGPDALPSQESPPRATTIVCLGCVWPALGPVRPPDTCRIPDTTDDLGHWAALGPIRRPDPWRIGHLLLPPRSPRVCPSRPQSQWSRRQRSRACGL